MSGMNRIAITMGEPRGVGPEIIVKCLSCSEVRLHCDPIVIGDAEVIKKAVRLTGLSQEVVPLSDMSMSRPATGRIEVFDMKTGLSGREVSPADCGRAVVEYIRKAVALASAKEVKAVVTGPISKESLKAAGYPWPGHTELLAELTAAKDVTMMFVSNRFRVLLCTIHVPLKDVAGLVSKKNVLKTIEHAARGADMLNIKNPRIAVAGLNPHAGESGIFGSEEIEAIIPAVQEAAGNGINVTGPYPPDVVFYRALKGDFDMVVCMYHDQGLVPFKMLDFETGVNVTVGLPLIRTSPDHGTAFDIAWKNTANPSSMIEAIKLASRLQIRNEK